MMNEDVKFQLRRLYEDTRDRQFIVTLTSLCKIFSVSKIEILPKDK